MNAKKNSTEQFEPKTKKNNKSRIIKENNQLWESLKEIAREKRTQSYILKHILNILKFGNTLIKAKNLYISSITNLFM